jgi:hypothetical protein
MPKRKRYAVKESCRPCKKSGMITTYEGNPMECPYCCGTGTRTLSAVHPSHEMSKAATEILAPAGTPRFYAVRRCKQCGLREESHAAGHFLNNLDLPCEPTDAKA